MSAIKVKLLIQVSGEAEDILGLPPPISAEMTFDSEVVDCLKGHHDLDGVKEIVDLWWREIRKTLPDKMVETVKTYLGPDVKFHDVSFADPGMGGEPIKALSPKEGKEVVQWWPNEVTCKFCNRIFRFEREPEYLTECICGKMIVVEPPSTLDLARIEEAKASAELSECPEAGQSIRIEKIREEAKTRCPDCGEEMKAAFILGNEGTPNYCHKCDERKDRIKGDGDVNLS